MLLQLIHLTHHYLTNAIHTINFLDGNFDVIYQWVFDPKMLIERYESLGYKVKVLNDFTESEIQSTGEKVRYVIDKVML